MSRGAIREQEPQGRGSGTRLGVVICIVGIVIVSVIVSVIDTVVVISIVTATDTVIMTARITSYCHYCCYR